MVLEIKCVTLLVDIWTIWICCLYVFCYYHILSYSLRSIFYQCICGCIPVWYCNLCIFIVMSMYSYCVFMYVNCASWHSSATLIEVFPCFFVGCKANARIWQSKRGHGPHSSKTFCVVLCAVFLSFCVLCVCVCVCVCKCVLCYCHRVAIQLQFNKYIISNLIISKWFWDWPFLFQGPKMCPAISSWAIPLMYKKTHIFNVLTENSVVLWQNVSISLLNLITRKWEFCRALLTDNLLAVQTIRTHKN